MKIVGHLMDLLQGNGASSTKYTKKWVDIIFGSQNPKKNEA